MSRCPNPEVPKSKLASLHKNEKLWLILALKVRKKEMSCFLNQNWTKYSRLFGKVLVPMACLCLTTDQSSTRATNPCVIIRKQRTTRSSVGIWKSIVTYNTSCIIQNKGEAHSTDNSKILDYRELILVWIHLWSIVILTTIHCGTPMAFGER